MNHGALPPLAKVPHLRRLLWPGEEVIYTAKLHWLNGWYWLVGLGMVMGLAVLVNAWFGLLVAVFGGLYGVVFVTNEIAVTSQRLLLRIGTFRLMVMTVEPTELAEWKLVQNPLTSLLRAGEVTLVLRAGREAERLTLPLLAHPMTFLEALETLEYKKHAR